MARIQFVSFVEMLSPLLILGVVLEASSTGQCVVEWEALKLVSCIQDAQKSNAYFLGSYCKVIHKFSINYACLYSILLLKIAIVSEIDLA